MIRNINTYENEFNLTVKGLPNFLMQVTFEQLISVKYREKSYRELIRNLF